MNKLFSVFIVIVFFGCKESIEVVSPTIEPITESVYASGIIKSKNQYQVYATVNGIVKNIYVSEGDSVNVGTAILSISNETQKLIKENAELNEKYSDVIANQGKLDEAKLLIELSKSKMKNDSLMLDRQKKLWQQQIGAKVELEQKELAYQNAKTNYYSSVTKYNDLQRQLKFTSEQSKKNLLISSKQENDFIVKSEIKGIVYELFKSKGEMVSIQTPLAIIGDAKLFLLEMQVDEYDIFKIKQGLTVLVTMDSYKDEVFIAKVSKVYPLMNERSKTFLVEAAFVETPPVLYPNITFEANIVLQSKENALTIPRDYLINDSIVIKSNGDKVVVKTGLKNFQKVEILSGISSHDELKKAAE